MPDEKQVRKQQAAALAKDITRKERIIYKTLRVKSRDSLPYTGWLKSTRTDLAKLFHTFEYKIGAEIGVAGGWHARNICRNVPGVKLICVDPWSAFNRSTEAATQRAYETAQNRLRKFDVEFMRMTSMEAVQKIEDHSLDFVYIDGLHEFDPVIMDIICWTQKVRFGGIVSGHDYIEFYQGGIPKAVNAYTRAHNINSWYVTTNISTPENVCQSWFWINRPEHVQGYSHIRRNV
jgi:predicted O-methyltransferase YrrM